MVINHAMSCGLSWFTCPFLWVTRVTRVPHEVTKGRGDAVMIEKSPVHLSANHLQMPGVRGARGDKRCGKRMVRHVP